jgi:ferredoxin
MRITVDYDKCIGAGNCVDAAGQTFDQRDEDGMVVLLQENPPEADRQAARTAAQLCPALAITVED